MTYIVPCDLIPKGWVSIDEHCPMELYDGLIEGFSVKVKDNEGNEYMSMVHSDWSELAKEVGVTHWWND